MSMRVTRCLAAGGAALALVLGAVLGASPASAAERNGVVESGEFGMYYLSDFRGPIFDLYFSDSNFAGDYFPGTSISANNNTESDWNRDTYTWWVYTGASATGSEGYVSPGEFGNFSVTFKNTVTSAYWYKAR